MTTRWGVIGTGDISGRFVPDLQEVSGGNVQGVWGRASQRADRFAAQNGVPFATDDLAGLLRRDDIDAVYIATPMHTHLDIALQALDAGKHVLVEKPMATSSGDVAIIFERAREVGRFAMEAMWMRFNPLHLDIMRRISEGVLGDVRSVRASFGMPFRPSAGKPNPDSIGSAWLDRGIYAVTLAHWALGVPTAVAATGVVEAATDVAGHATLEFDGGRFAQLACSGVEFLDLSAAVSGDRGWIGIDPMFWAASTAEVRAGSMQAIFHSPERVEHRREGNGFRPMLRALEGALADGRLQQPEHDRESTLAVARTLDIIRDQILHPKGSDS